MRPRVLLLVAAMLAGLLPLRAAAGWRSADRPRDDRETIGPCERNCPDEPDQEWRDEQQRRHDHGRHDGSFESQGGFETMRDGHPAGPATQPYWGTMHPYWNAPEPPGVIHRGARTRGFDKTR
jgi:hypothetical protein